MLLLALAAVVSSGHHSQVPASQVPASQVPARQVLAGPAFERFAAQADKSCPARQLRMITPGDLSWAQERFEERLSSTQKQRVAAVDRSTTRCAGRDGLSCPTVETLAVLHRANLLRPFTAFACSHHQP